MDAPSAAHWLDAYFEAWGSTDPAQVGALFATDARYWVSPFTEPLRGRGEIVRSWVAGTSRLLDHASTVLAVDGEVVVAHWSVRLQRSGGAVVDIDGVLVLTFDAAGDCLSHREWFVTQPVTP